MKNLFFILIFLTFSTSILAQVKNGLLLGGGIGNIYNEQLSPTSKIQDEFVVDCKFDIHVGYRFKFQPKNTLFYYQIDGNLGMKKWDSEYGARYSSTQHASFTSSSYYGALTGTIHYPVYKKLNLGFGIEPTYYFFTEGEGIKSSFPIDIPLVAKIGYDFKFFELECGYRYGTCNVLRTEFLSSGKFGVLDFTLFIPF